MRMILAALFATAVAVAPAVAQPPNPFVTRLNAMSDLQRRAVLRGALVNSGQRCSRVEETIFRGPYRNLAMFSVRCGAGGDYGVFVGPDGSAQVRSCEDLAKLKLPTCQLPPVPPTVRRPIRPLAGG